MTYKQLLQKLQELSAEQLAMDVTVYDSLNDEFYPSTDLGITEGIDVLEDNHPIIKFGEEPI